MIGNLDEIHLKFNTVRNKFLARKGSQFIFTKTHGQERKTFTV